jgi:AcrR family transcriptional regulator
MDLLAKNAAPSIAEVAAAADVSRRTVYMYFPTLEHLLTDAALGLATQASVDRFVDPPLSKGDAESRVEALGRTIIRLTADARPGAPIPRRGYRRIEWIESALAPARERLDAPRFERLVSALAMVIGWEAVLVQRDIRGLSPRQAEDVSAWAARALVRATLAEIATVGTGRGSGRTKGTRRPRAAVDDPGGGPGTTSPSRRSRRADR